MAYRFPFTWMFMENKFSSRSIAIDKIVYDYDYYLHEVAKYKTNKKAHQQTEVQTVSNPKRIYS